MSNLDDMHGNGIHDYMKFVNLVMGDAPITHLKIYAGKLNRDRAILEVKKRSYKI